MRLILPLLVAVALGAPGARAQVAPNRFDVGAHIGYTRFATGTALENAPFGGLDGTYRIKLGALGGADLGVGFTFAVSRPLTRYDQFPLVQSDFGDTTFLYGVAQRITLLQYGAQAVLGYPIGRFRVYGLGGAGGYTMAPDVRQNLRVDKFTEPMITLGGGLNLAVTQSLGFRVEGRDLLFTNFDRDRLDPTVAYTRDSRIMDALPLPDKTSSRLHNLQLSLVFSYIPTRGGTGTAEGGQ